MEGTHTHSNVICTNLPKVEQTGLKIVLHVCTVVYVILGPPLDSETTPEGRKITKLDQILLNGNNITMLVPGGEYPVINLMGLDMRSPGELP